MLRTWLSREWYASTDTIRVPCTATSRCGVTPAFVSQAQRQRRIASNLCTGGTSLSSVRRQILLSNASCQAAVGPLVMRRSAAVSNSAHAAVALQLRQAWQHSRRFLNAWFVGSRTVPGPVESGSR